MKKPKAKTLTVAKTEIPGKVQKIRVTITEKKVRIVVPHYTEKQKKKR
jgi:hypothetical protein